MEDLSEAAIKANCPHCDAESQAFKYLLEDTDNFYIVHDAHPLSEGHLLIIPKQHLSCIAEYPDEVYEEFTKLNERVTNFVKSEYGSVSSFEHGIFGQTVFHSHVHYLPFNGAATDIVPEGEKKLTILHNLNDLKTILNKEGGYLFFSIGDEMWTVDKEIATPRFFRDRFAKALGKPERGNWKTMHVNEKMTSEADAEMSSTEKKWKSQARG